MNFDPGRVRLILKTSGGMVRAATVACERPAMSRLLRGRPAEEAVALVPLVYSLCGQAQGIAARAALAAARGERVAVGVDASAWAEGAREHAWKLFVDWPRQLGIPADEAFFVRLVRSAAGERDGLAGPLAAHPLPGQLAEAAGGSAIGRLVQARIEDRVCALRDWLRGAPGALGRVGAEPLGTAAGEARVETARGMLTHRLALDGGRIADYAISAPTDVVFAEGGEVARWLPLLDGLPRAAAEREARLLMLAFDPCVPWECRAED